MMTVYLAQGASITTGVCDSRVKVVGSLDAVARKCCGNVINADTSTNPKARDDQAFQTATEICNLNKAIISDCNVVPAGLLVALPPQCVKPPPKSNKTMVIILSTVIPIASVVIALVTLWVNEDFRNFVFCRRQRNRPMVG
jgi:hypothetical protein